MSYYYFGASLPLLSMESAPPFSPARFREMCRTHLSEEDVKALDPLISSLGSDPVAPADADGAADSKPSRAVRRFLSEWQNLETQLRNASARHRSARTQRDATPYLREFGAVTMAVEKGVADAFSKRTPSEREFALDRLRWNLAEDLAGPAPFSIRAILAYALKLSIAERWARLDAERGRQTVGAVVENQAAEGAKARSGT